LILQQFDQRRQIGFCFADPAKRKGSVAARPRVLIFQQFAQSRRGLPGFNADLTQSESGVAPDLVIAILESFDQSGDANLLILVLRLLNKSRSLSFLLSENGREGIEAE
jgi:hypothetical protein